MHKLAETARETALRCYHGYVCGTESNLDEIIAPFPGWTKREADGLWCAAFVYYCCRQAGYSFSIRPVDGLSCNLAGCIAWEEWARADERLAYILPDTPSIGDIVLFDRVFDGSEHDHMGIVVAVSDNAITVAEGNFNNVSTLVDRKRDDHIRCCIRLPEILCESEM